MADERALASLLHWRLMQCLPADVQANYPMHGGDTAAQIGDTVRRGLVDHWPGRWRFKRWEEVLFLGMWPTGRDDDNDVQKCPWGWPASWWKPLPAQPTDAEPGTPEKIAILRDRAERGEELFAASDRWYGEEAKKAR